MTCRRSVAFVTAVEDQDTGLIAMARCEEDSTRLRDLVQQAVPGLRRSDIDRRDDQARNAAGFYQTRRLSDGSELHYFPVLIVAGHGAGAVHTVVLFDGGRAVLAQGGGRAPCDSTLAADLCAHDRDGLVAIAQRLQALVP